MFLSWVYLTPFIPPYFEINLCTFSRENVSWASTCNTVGQTLGYIIGFIVFLVLESPDVCNNYLRSVPVPGEGIISFSGMF